VFISGTPPPASLVTVSCDLCGAQPGQPFVEKLGGYYTRCADCGFVYANPRDPNPAIYNAANNEALRGSYAAKQYSAAHQRIYAAQLRRLARFRQTNRLLEVGCSTGGFCFRARQEGWDCVGLEPVGPVAAYGREFHHLDIRASTLEEAGLAENHFDVVFSNAVLEHVASPGSVLREVCRVLRPGGVVLTDTVNIDSYTWRFIGADWKLIDPRAHLSLFAPPTLRRFCEQAGLRVLKTSTRGVRFRAGRADRPVGWLRWYEELVKFPFSLAARVTLRGDRIAVLAQKPPLRAPAA